MRFILAGALSVLSIQPVLAKFTDCPNGFLPPPKLSNRGLAPALTHDHSNTRPAVSPVDSSRQLVRYVDKNGNYRFKLVRLSSSNQ